MKHEVAQAICTAAEDNELDVRLEADYSGRGMFGTKTTAIVYGCISDLVQAVACAAASDNLPAGGVENFAFELRGLREDSLGRKTILY
jgi:hypothetical protein